MNTEYVGSIIDVALQIADEEARVLEEMRAALLANDRERALACAKRLCGIEDESHAA